MIGMMTQSLDKSGFGLIDPFDSVASHRERFPRLGVRCVQRNAALQMRDRLRRLPPTQQPRAQNPMCVCVVRRQVARAYVRLQRPLVLPFEFVGEADFDHGPRVSRTQRRQLRERSSSLRRLLCHQLRARQLQPACSLFRIRLSGGFKVPSSTLELPVTHGAPAQSDVARSTRGDKQHDQDQARLTCRGNAPTMRGMEAVTLGNILAHASGVDLKGNIYETAEGHRLSFYIGRGGQAMVLSDILKVELHEGFVRLERRQADGTLYFELSVVHGVAIRRPEDSKAGFS